MPPFDVEAFAFKNIAIMCETTDERDDFLKHMKNTWPTYMRNWSGSYNLSARYVIGYHGSTNLQVDPVGDVLKREGYTTITYTELCGMQTKFDELGSLDELLG